MHLLDLDPDLAEGLDPQREAIARERLTVRVERVERGRWTPRAGEFGAVGGIGLLVAEGLAIRQVSLAHRAAAELLGPGDVLRPWGDGGEPAAYPVSASVRLSGTLSPGDT